MTMGGDPGLVATKVWHRGAGEFVSAPVFRFKRNNFFTHESCEICIDLTYFLNACDDSV